MGHGVTLGGDAHVCTELGVNSIHLDGTGDFVRMEDSQDWNLGTRDFIIETDVYFNSFGNGNQNRGNVLLARSGWYYGWEFGLNGLQFTGDGTLSISRRDDGINCLNGHILSYRIAKGQASSLNEVLHLSIVDGVLIDEMGHGVTLGGDAHVSTELGVPSIRLDGYGDFIRMEDSQDWNLGSDPDFIIETDIYLKSFQNQNGGNVNFARSGWYYGWGFGLLGDGRLIFNDYESDWVLLSPPLDWNLNEIYNLKVVRNKTTITIYRNNIAVASGTGPGGVLVFYDYNAGWGVWSPPLDWNLHEIYNLKVVRNGTTITIYRNNIAVASGTTTAGFAGDGTLSISRRDDGINCLNGHILSYRIGKALPNTCPTANAGDNSTIFSEEQNQKIIYGIGTDPDNDTLTYRWLEGETELVSWQPIGLNGECPLDLGPLPDFLSGEHFLTLEINDGKCVSKDEMILTVNNSAPHPAPTGGGVCEINTQFTLTGQVSDYDGDQVYYDWFEGGSLLFNGWVSTISGGEPVYLPGHIYQCLALGDHDIILTANDGVNPTIGAIPIKIKVTDTTAPTLSPVPNKNILWPPNYDMVNITIQANARDNNGGPVTLSALVYSNEPQEGLGDGDMSPDWTTPVIDQINGIIALQFRAERSGRGEGRVYTIVITVTDQSGNSSQAAMDIIVPHDQRNK